MTKEQQAISDAEILQVKETAERVITHRASPAEEKQLLSILEQAAKNVQNKDKHVVRDFLTAAVGDFPAAIILGVFGAATLKVATAAQATNTDLGSAFYFLLVGAGLAGLGFFKKILTEGDNTPLTIAGFGTGMLGTTAAIQFYGESIATFMVEFGNSLLQSGAPTPCYSLALC